MAIAATSKALEAQARAALELPSHGSLEHDLREEQHTLAPRCLPRTAKPWWKSLMRIFVFTDSPTTVLMRMSDVNTACDTSLQWYVPLTELLQPLRLDATAAIQLLPAFAALAQQQMKQPGSALPCELVKHTLATFVTSLGEPADVWRGVLAVLQGPQGPPPELRQAFDKVCATFAPIAAAAEAAAGRVRAAEAELQRAKAALDDARATHDTLKELVDRSTALQSFPLFRM